jgi:hypothetical protein
MGATIINEIIFALDRLRNHSWRGVYYLYVDEAGRYANRNLADLPAYKRKAGLGGFLSHPRTTSSDRKRCGASKTPSPRRSKPSLGAPLRDDRPPRQVPSSSLTGILSPSTFTYPMLTQSAKTDPSTCLFFVMRLVNKPERPHLLESHLKSAEILHFPYVNTPTDNNE